VSLLLDQENGLSKKFNNPSVWCLAWQASIIIPLAYVRIEQRSLIPQLCETHIGKSLKGYGTKQTNKLDNQQCRIT